MNIKFKRTNSFAKTPVYATSGAACFDLHAVSINGSMNIGDIVYEGHPVICDTGLAFAVPDGYMLAIRSRSGLAFNHGIHAFHGTVDSDYTGSVKVLLMAEARDECPVCDKEFWVQGGWTPKFSTAIAEELL